LVNEKFCFREKFSNEMATYTLLNNVLSSLVKKMLVDYSVTCKRHSIVLTIIYFWLIWNFMEFQV